MSEELKPEEIFAEGGAAKVIAMAEKEAAEFVGDVTTIKGREAIKSKAYAIGSTMKAKFDKMGKDYGEDLKKKAKVIDGERAKIRERLEELGEQIRKPVNEFEAREEARINLIKEQLAALESYGVLTGEETADDLQGKINAINGFNFTDWQEFGAQAEDTKFNVLELLGKRMITAAKAEEDRKELERLRAAEDERKKKQEAEDAERERIAKEEKLKKDAAEAAIKAEQEKQAEAQRIADAAIKEKEEAEERARVAEQQRLEAIEQAERDKVAAAQKAAEEREAADKRAKEAAEQAERDRQAAAQKAEEEKAAAVEAERQRIAKAKADEEAAAKKREADIEHKKSVNNEALKAIAEHAKISEDDAKNVVIAIAMGMVPSVKIFY